MITGYVSSMNVPEPKPWWREVPGLKLWKDAAVTISLFYVKVRNTLICTSLATAEMALDCGNLDVDDWARWTVGFLCPNHRENRIDPLLLRNMLPINPWSSGFPVTDQSSELQ